MGELFWYLAKSDDVEQIAYYITAYREDAEEGRIYGAYGPRIFSMRGNHDQFANVAALLKERGTSRKAVIQLLNAEDVASGHKEIPCTCDFQFLIRAKRLHMVAHMRPNDAFLGLPHDIFAFTMLQEILARKLGVELGEYSHMIGSLHLYEEDEEDARQYVAEGWQPTLTAAMPPMPAGDQQPEVDAIVSAEALIRRGENVDIGALQLAPYWADLARLLQIFWHQKYGTDTAIQALSKGMSTHIYDAYISRAEQRSKAPRKDQVGDMVTEGLKFCSDRHVSDTTADETMTHALKESLLDLIHRLQRVPLIENNVIPWSCPVPSFGDISTSVVATLGLNPSNREFVDNSGNEFDGRRRRLHTLRSLGLDRWCDLDLKQAYPPRP